MIILKLGGSVITDKNIPFTFRAALVNQLASEIAWFYPKDRVILVHGTGSFGHPLAKKYNIRAGLHGKDRRAGIAKTHQAMQKLNVNLCEIFLHHNLPVYTLTTSSLFIIDKGEIVDAWTVTIEALFDKGFIPVLYGDLSVSLNMGMDVLSGDQLITFLSSRLKPEKVIFVTDVDGLYDKYPGTDALLIDFIDRRRDTVEWLQKDSRKEDVTGGIANKIQEAMKMSCPVIIVNGLKPGNCTKALEGQNVGTLIAG